MKLNRINPGAIAILCAGSLAIALVARAITAPPKSTPAVQKNPAPTKSTPPAVKSTPAPTPTPTAKPSTPSPTGNSPAKATPATPPAANIQPTPKSSVIPLVAVPALTPATINSFTKIYGQIIDTKFTPKQQQRIAQRVNQDWMLNLGLRNTVSQTIALESQLANATSAERTQLQTKAIGNLRQQAVEGDLDALWLIAFVDAIPKNWLAKGTPPLTRTATDMGADALAFMVNEIMGRTVVTADSKLKNAIATKLTSEYPKLSPTIKQELSRLPANWLKFRDSEWYSRGDEFRENMRVHWGQNLEASIPELKDMIQLRRDRLTKLKTDPKIKWSSLNNVQRQAALQQSDLEFQNSIRTLPPVKTVRLNDYINTMQVGNAIGNSPTRYSLKLNVK